MSVQILSNQDCCFGGYNVKSAINQVAMDMGADALDSTTFGSAGNREFTGGLITMGFTMAGFYQRTALDLALLDSVALNDTVVTVCPQNAAAGSPAYFMQAVETKYTLGASIGDLLAFDVAAQNSTNSGQIRGTLMLNSSTLTATGSSTGRQLGAVGATQKLYAAAHVFGVQGTSSPTITFTVESDNNSGFTSPTTQLTFDAFSDIGSAWLELAGAITDDYWRISYTITGTNPNFSAMVSLGIK